LLDLIPGTNAFCHSEAACMSPDTKIVLRPAFIRGQGYGRFCTVSTVKANDPTLPNLTPYRCPIKVQDKDDFPDSNYELVLGAQTFVLKKTKGDYLPIVYETLPNNAASS
jgi:hypothetical protein